MPSNRATWLSMLEAGPTTSPDPDGVAQPTAPAVTPRKVPLAPTANLAGAPATPPTIISSAVVIGLVIPAPPPGESSIHADPSQVLYSVVSSEYQIPNEPCIKDGATGRSAMLPEPR